MSRKRSIIIFVSVMIILTSLGCYYLEERIVWAWPFLEKFKNYIFITLGLYVFMQVLGPISYRISPLSKQRPFILQWLTYISMGFFASLFFYFLVAEIMVFVIFKAAHLFMQSPDVFKLETLELHFFQGISVVSVVTALWGMLTALKSPVIENVDVEIKNLPADFKGFKIAQISDLHVGPTISHRYAEKVVNLVNDLNPDIIVLTGDIVDGMADQLREQIQPLKNLKAPLGVYYCTGNHEYYWGGEQWCQEFQKIGFKVLLNQHQILKKGSSQIALGGIPDIRGGQFVQSHHPDIAKTFKGVSKEMIKILMAHQPSAYKLSLEGGVHLQLSGHTHGGQFFPWSILVALTQKFYKGLYLHQNLWIYTNRGTGYWGPPQRFSVPPEITLLQLT